MDRTKVSRSDIAAADELLSWVNGLILHKSRAALFVWGIWTVMLVAALSFIWNYGSNVPSWDDWDMVPMMTGYQPVTASWLWSQHNEHRVPVPRIISLALYRLIAPDFRVGMYFNVLIMGALAFAMIVVAKRLRGRMNYSDAFFPLLLLNWGQGLNFIWSWQIEFFSSTVLAGVVLLIIAQSDIQLETGTAVATGICLFLLAMCGAHGVALVPALALWLGYSAVLRWRSGNHHAKRDGFFALILALLALMLVGLYFVGYEKVPYHSSSHDLKATLRTAVQFLAMGFGPAVRSVRTFSGIGVVCLLLFIVAALATAAWNQPRERVRASGFIMFLGAMASLALGIGLGRDGFEPRYVTLSVPTLCCIYFVVELYVPPKIGHVLQPVLLVLVCVALWLNTNFGFAYGKELRSILGSFERDMVAGVPSYQLINRYGEYLHPHHEIPNDYMPMLRQAGVGYFQFLQENPALREVALPLVPTGLNQVRWEEGTAYATGNKPYLVFDLPDERYVSGIRLKYSYVNAEHTCPYISFYWKRSDQSDFTQDQFKKYSPTGDKANWCHGTWTQINESETTMTIWICDTVNQIRIHPDFKPGVFKVSEIVLLEPVVE